MTAGVTPDQVEAIARVAHEANRAYCYTIGDYSQPPWADAPDWQKASAMQGVMAIADGVVQTPMDSHINWLETKRAGGWTHGEEKDEDAKTHPCMVPFAKLPVEQQAKDHLFFAVVTALLAAQSADE